MSPGDGGGPGVTSSEAPTAQTANRQAASAVESSGYWQGRRDFVTAWLPYADREAVEVFALREFDRGESAAYLIAEQIERDQRIAERMASIEVAAAEDWTAASRRPSHAELVERRAVVVVPR